MSYCGTRETTEKENGRKQKRRETDSASNEYGCEILLEKTTIEKSKDASFPNDAYSNLVCCE
jgi:hypothetical protein